MRLTQQSIIRRGKIFLFQITVMIRYGRAGTSWIRRRLALRTRNGLQYLYASTSPSFSWEPATTFSARRACPVGLWRHWRRRRHKWRVDNAAVREVATNGVLTTGQGVPARIACRLVGRSPAGGNSTDRTPPSSSPYYQQVATKEKSAFPCFCSHYFFLRRTVLCCTTALHFFFLYKRGRK